MASLVDVPSHIIPCCNGMYDHIRINNIVSLILSLLVMTASGLTLRDTYEIRNSPEFKFGVSFWTMYKEMLATGSKDTVYGPSMIDARMDKITKYDPDKILRLRLILAAWVFAASILQFFSGVVFFIYSSLKVAERPASGIYISINILIWATIGFVIGGFMTQEMGKLDKLMPFIAATTIDFLFLIYLLVLAFYYYHRS